MVRRKSTGCFSFYMLRDGISNDGFSPEACLYSIPDREEDDELRTEINYPCAEIVNVFYPVIENGTEIQTKLKRVSVFTSANPFSPFDVKVNLTAGDSPSSYEQLLIEKELVLLAGTAGGLASALKNFVLLFDEESIDTFIMEYFQKHAGKVSDNIPTSGVRKVLLPLEALVSKIEALEKFLETVMTSETIGESKDNMYLALERKKRGDTDDYAVALEGFKKKMRGIYAFYITSFMRKFPFSELENEFKKLSKDARFFISSVLEEFQDLERELSKEEASEIAKLIIKIFSLSVKLDFFARRALPAVDSFYRVLCDVCDELSFDTFMSSELLKSFVAATWLKPGLGLQELEEVLKNIKEFEDILKLKKPLDWMANKVYFLSNEFEMGFATLLVWGNKAYKDLLDLRVAFYSLVETVIKNAEKNRADYKHRVLELLLPLKQLTDNYDEAVYETFTQLEGELVATMNDIGSFLSRRFFPSGIGTSKDESELYSLIFPSLEESVHVFYSAMISVEEFWRAFHGSQEDARKVFKAFTFEGEKKSPKDSISLFLGKVAELRANFEALKVLLTKKKLPFPENQAANLERGFEAIRKIISDFKKRCSLHLEVEEKCVAVGGRKVSRIAALAELVKEKTRFTFQSGKGHSLSGGLIFNDLCVSEPELERIFRRCKFRSRNKAKRLKNWYLMLKGRYSVGEIENMDFDKIKSLVRFVPDVYVSHYSPSFFGAFPFLEFENLRNSTTDKKRLDKDILFDLNLSRKRVRVKRLRNPFFKVVPNEDTKIFSEIAGKLGKNPSLCFAFLDGMVTEKLLEKEIYQKTFMRFPSKDERKELQQIKTTEKDSHDDFRLKLEIEL